PHRTRHRRGAGHLSRHGEEHQCPRPRQAPGLTRPRRAGGNASGDLMRDIDDLRRALDTDSASVAIQVAPERIRARARAVRARRSAPVGGLPGVAGMAVRGAREVAKPILAPAVSSCASPVATGGSDTRLDQTLETGVVLPAPDLHTEYDVSFGLTG